MNDPRADLWEIAAEASEEAVFGLDADGRVVAWTTSAARLFGHTADAIIGQASTALLSPADTRMHSQRLARVLDGERIDRMRVEARRASGMPLPISLTLVPLPGRTGICVVARDLTETEWAQATLAESEQRLHEAQALSHVGLWLWDRDSDALQLSDELHRIHDLDPLEFEGTMTAYLAAIHPDDQGAFEADLERSVADEVPLQGEYRFVRPDGEHGWVYLRAALEYQEAAVVGLRGIAQDITERKRAANALEQQASLLELLRRIAVAANEASTVEEALSTCVGDIGAYAGWDVGRVHYVDGDRAVLSGPSHTTDPSRFEELGRHAGAAGDLIDEVLRTGRPAWRDQLSAEASAAELTGAIAFPLVVGGDVVAVLEFFSTEQTPDENLVATVWHGANQLGRVAERMRARDELSHQALHDAVTGLPNRALLLDRLAHSFDRLKREPGYVAVIFLDLDNFKLINDSLGHEVGDGLLVTIARRLERVIRPQDTAARFGGDEFIVLCDGLSSEEAAVDIADRVLAALAAPIALNGHSDTVINASAGIAIASGYDATPESLLRDADSAMYRAKEEGRNRYRIFDSAMHQRATERLAIANELRTAIDENQLRLVYQPQFDIRTSEIMGVEALVRWEHPVRGELSPLEFIPVAEETQQIVRLGGWVLREACRQAAAWHELRPAKPGETGLKLCVNVSAKQLARPELIDDVRDALAESGLDAACLCVEITESVLMTDADFFLDALLGIKLLGVNVAIDDFGTGYSSLAYLRRFPIDVIKVDKGFVDGLSKDDPRGAAVVAAVVDLAHALELETVAEGVETADQLGALEALGCDVGQGYLFSRPVRPEEITAMLCGNADNGHEADELGERHRSADVLRLPARGG